MQVSVKDIHMQGMMQYTMASYMETQASIFGFHDVGRCALCRKRISEEDRPFAVKIGDDRRFLCTGCVDMVRSVKARLRIQ